MTDTQLGANEYIYIQVSLQRIIQNTKKRRANYTKKEKKRMRRKKQVEPQKNKKKETIKCGNIKLERQEGDPLNWRSSQSPIPCASRATPLSPRGGAGPAVHPRGAV